MWMGCSLSLLLEAFKGKRFPVAEAFFAKQLLDEYILFETGHTIVSNHILASVLNTVNS